MRTPVLIIHSEDDLRCPVSQAEELLVALRWLGREPEMVRFPDETHELSRSGSPRHRIMRAQLILDWFRKHLCNGEAILLAPSLGDCLRITRSFRGLRFMMCYERDGGYWGDAGGEVRGDLPAS